MARVLWSLRRTKRRYGSSGRTTARRSAARAFESWPRMPRKARKRTRRWSATTGNGGALVLVPSSIVQYLYTDSELQYIATLAYFCCVQVV